MNSISPDGGLSVPTRAARSVTTLRNAKPILAIVLVAFAAGCANVKLPAVIADRLPGGGSSTSAPATKAPPVGSSSGINLAGNCIQTEVDGYIEDAQVSVQAGTVQSLAWKVKVGRKGSCAFDGTGFRQTKTAPSIEMLARDGSGCRLLMWSDNRRITLAHNGCEKFCTKGVYDKAWPVMFDPSSGGCADTSR